MAAKVREARATSLWQKLFDPYYNMRKLLLKILSDTLILYWYDPKHNIQLSGAKTSIKPSGKKPL
jgi:hypothetical protein